MAVVSTETSPVCGVRRNPSLLDYPGHLAALFYTAGCNFRCRFCQNSELMSSVQFAVEQALGIPVGQVNVNVQKIHMEGSTT